MYRRGGLGREEADSRLLSSGQDRRYQQRDREGPGQTEAPSAVEPATTSKHIGLVLGMAPHGGSLPGDPRRIKPVEWRQLPSTPWRVLVA